MILHHVMVNRHNQTKMLVAYFQAKIDLTAKTFFSLLNLLDISMILL